MNNVQTCRHCCEVPIAGDAITVTLLSPALTVHCGKIFPLIQKVDLRHVSSKKNTAEPNYRNHWLLEHFVIIVKKFKKKHLAVLSIFTAVLIP